MVTFSIVTSFFFFFEWFGDHRALHSFPTRRSSDLEEFDGLEVGRVLFGEFVLLVAGDEGEGLNVVMEIGEGEFDGSDAALDRKSTRLNSSHGYISYAVFCLKKKKHKE